MKSQKKPQKHGPGGVDWVFWIWLVVSAVASGIVGGAIGSFAIWLVAK